MWSNVPTDDPRSLMQEETSNIDIDLGLNGSEDEWDEEGDAEDD